MKRPTFPQANSMERILATVRVTSRRNTSITELSAIIGVTKRQALYYASGAEHLGLVVREGGVKATEKGRNLAATRSEKSRRVKLSDILATLPVFKRALKAARLGRPASRETVATWISKHNGLSPSTAARRAATVEKWVASAV